MDCLKISVPAIVYVIQNNLLYVAISHLDASTYQVSIQFIIFALFRVFTKSLHIWATYMAHGVVSQA